jgi:hypothetical protein
MARKDAHRSCSFLYFGTPDQILLSCTPWAYDSPTFATGWSAPSGGNGPVDYTICEGSGCELVPQYVDQNAESAYGGSGVPFEPGTTWPTPSANGLAWSKAAHEKYLDLAFPTACPEMVDKLKRVSFDQDWNYSGNDSGQTIRHALVPRGGTLTPAQGNVAVDPWITDNLNRARSEAALGHWRSSTVHLGMALHTISDRLSPVHTDDMGQPRYNQNMLGTFWNHSPTDFFGGETSGSPEWEAMKGRVVVQYRAALQFVESGLTPPSDCGAYGFYMPRG